MSYIDTSDDWRIDRCCSIGMAAIQSIFSVKKPGLYINIVGRTTVASSLSAPIIILLFVLAQWYNFAFFFLPILSCAVLCQIVSLQYLSRSSLHRLAGLPCCLFFSYGLQVVTSEVHRLAVHVLCPGPFHFCHIADYV